MSDVTRGRIIEWNHEKGYGFVDNGRERVFLHRRDFRQWHKAPRPGDVLSYVVGSDAQGRKCAKDAEHVNDGGRFGVGALVVLFGLMLAPAWAVFQARTWLDWRLATGWFASISIVTYAAYAFDKKRAREKGQRTHESTLHLCELLGGWPGAFVAQRRIRHKATKGRYQFWFWLIVTAHEYVAIESVIDWQMTRQLRSWAGF